MKHAPDHIGVDLWRAFKAYEAAMFEQVAQLGFEDITVADSDVLVQIGEAGASMVQIASARGVSKQAIQGQVKSLALRGYVAVKPDPDDARARRVVHTQKGRELVAAFVDVKLKLHADVEAKLGTERTKNLRNMLAQVVGATTV